MNTFTKELKSTSLSILPIAIIYILFLSSQYFSVAQNFLRFTFAEKLISISWMFLLLGITYYPYFIIGVIFFLLLTKSFPKAHSSEKKRKTNYLREIFTSIVSVFLFTLLYIFIFTFGMFTVGIIGKVGGGGI